MRKINNPFHELEGYNCFACCPNNEHGLQMDFYEDGDYVCAKWTPKTYFEGYPNILHGGIQSTLLDEIAAWAVYVKGQTSGVTSRMNVKYHKPVLVRGNSLLLRAKILEVRRRFANIKAELINSDGEVCSEADLVYYMYPQEIAKTQYFYPEYSKFFDENK
ncbi:MAG: PaaI family thioesterase [Bacteroidales bacterium]|nr:PaaI family thioesterase [Bacteroidales bacterium]